MLLSRGATALRALRCLSKNKGQLQQTVRHGHTAWAYRKGTAPPTKTLFMIADFTQGVMWWWILWHLWTEPDHILGEFAWPDSRKWTDEELGIPETLELDE
ncbi:unnamed protein product [Ceutorhynchus assimilis]|uniref:NADH dehydrogenase [ubiquinone] 1 beta subcomplex subunit 2, mitochondrial n=1 Tax=Ceutorhynchus assimilis TaxID=467358 RepID=A0A9N9MLF6_9CUCU|nr:unnamed protein product [Ceutorhynchus assimilis]